MSRLRGVAKLAAAGLIACALGGCSMSYQMGGAFDKPADKLDVTASITRPGKPSDSDLASAKKAASDLLSRGTKDGSQPWENPATGASGTITPMAAAYAQDGTECRDFLASYVHGSSEAWYQGDACRKGQRWEVRTLKPLRRT